MSYPIISADSHITEAPDTYTANIDRAWRDRLHSTSGGSRRTRTERTSCG